MKGDKTNKGDFITCCMYDLHAERDYARKPSAMSWGIDDIGSEKYYNETDYVAGSAVVEIVDTGIDLSHSFFEGKLVNSNLKDFNMDASKIGDSTARRC